MKLGEKVIVETQAVNKEKSQNSKEKRIRKGTLVALYPHIFAVDFGRYVECFRYNQLFGGEETGVRV